MLYKNRKKYATFEDKLASFFGKMSKNADFWTCLSLASAISSAYFVATESFLLAGLLLAISAILDVVDGSVARLYKKATNRGAYLDTIFDRYAEAAVIAALIFVPLPSAIFPAATWIALLLFGSMMTTYTKAAAAEKSLASPIGVLMERAERMFLIFATIIIGHFSRVYMLYAIIVLAILTNLSALQRIRMVLK